MGQPEKERSEGWDLPVLKITFSVDITTEDLAARIVVGVWWGLNTLPTMPELTSHSPVYCVHLFGVQWLIEIYVTCSQRK